MRLPNFFAAFAVVAVLIGCGKDKEDPTLTINSPPEAALIHWGDIIHAEATFLDDKKLSSWHIHTGDSLGNHIESWEYENTGDISKGIYTWSQHISVPDSVPDSVWLHFEITDAVGKTAEDNVLLIISP